MCPARCDMSSKWPNEARVQVSNLLNCVIMCDVDLSFYDVNDLAMMASDFLDQFRKGGMPDSIHRRVLDTAHQTNNLEKLKGLVTRFEAAIQAHDAEVAAAQVALSAHQSLAMETVDGMHASYGNTFFRHYKRQPQRNQRQNQREFATRGGARGESLIKLSRPHKKDLRQNQEAV
jgi:hypothetical protein